MDACGWGLRGELLLLNIQVAFRVDASERIGTGHFMRCLTLANSLRGYGIESVFVARHCNMQLVQMLEDLGHKFCNIEQCHAPVPSNLEGYADWLGVTQCQDAQDTLAALEGQVVTGFVVDHYALDAVWERGIADGANVPIMAIDDLCRSHIAQIIVDATYARTADAYHASKGAEVLAGTQYALLRPEFAANRILAEIKRQENAPVACVLVAMGGADPDNLSERFVSALLPTLRAHNIRLAVLTGAAYANADRMKAAAAASGGALIHYHNVTEVAPLLMDADVCIGAAGATSWERCCLGLPTISVVLAENQMEISRQLARADAIVDGGSSLPQSRQALYDQIDDGGWACQHLMPLIADGMARSRMSEAMMALVDGHGSTRVANHFAERIFGERALWLRPATSSDSKAVYHWRYAGNAARYYGSTKVPEFAAHDEWFQRALNDPKRHLLIAQSELEGVSHLRFDCSDDTTEISICVNPDLRGQNIGSKTLRAALRYGKQRNLGPITARVHQQNQISVRLFGSAGFHTVSQDGEFLVMQALQA